MNEAIFKSLPNVLATPLIIAQFVFLEKFTGNLMRILESSEPDFNIIHHKFHTTLILGGFHPTPIRTQQGINLNQPITQK